MSVYPPPNEINSIYNPANFQQSTSSLTIAEADERYGRLAGSIYSGLSTFNAGIQTANIFNAGKTFSMPSNNGQLALVSQIVDGTSASNLGTGDGIFAQEIVNDLQFKSLVAGSNITLTPSSTEIKISSSGGGGVTFPILADDGTQAAPSYSFSNNSQTGLWYDSLISGSLNISVDNSAILQFIQGRINAPVPIYGTQPFAYYTNTSNQLISNVSETTVLFPTSVENTGVVSYSSGIFTLTNSTDYDGRYLICYKIIYDGAATALSSYMEAYVRINNAGRYVYSSSIIMGLANATPLSLCMVVDLNGGDDVRLITGQNSGSSVNILGATYTSEFSLYKLI